MWPRAATCVRRDRPTLRPALGLHPLCRADRDERPQRGHRARRRGQREPPVSRPARPVAAHSPPRISSNASKPTTPPRWRSIPTRHVHGARRARHRDRQGPPRRAGHPRLRRLSCPATSSCRPPKSWDRSAVHGVAKGATGLGHPGRGQAGHAPAEGPSCERVDVVEVDDAVGWDAVRGGLRTSSEISPRRVRVSAATTGWSPFLPCCCISDAPVGACADMTQLR